MKALALLFAVVLLPALGLFAHINPFGAATLVRGYFAGFGVSDLAFAVGAAVATFLLFLAIARGMFDSQTVGPEADS